MAVKFYPHNHTYESTDIFDKIDWTSVTALISKFRPPFDPKQSSVDCSLNKKSKWYGIHPDEIQALWKKENTRSTDLGNWYHKKKEELLLLNETAERYERTLQIIKPLYEEGEKIAPDQRLVDGIYPEHFIYLKAQGVCGQSDEVIVSNGVLHVHDHKSNKDLKKPPYKSWKGVVKTLLAPLSHVEDSKLAEYSLQLSTYAYMILKHNPQLKLGKLVLNYVTFEEEGRDKFDYPIMKLDENGEYIVRSEEPIELPYMKKEVEIMFQHKKALDGRSV